MTPARPSSPARVPALAGLALLAATACGAGKGSGTVESDRLYVENCWDGPFNLGPTFFASDPYADTQQIRIQRGERMVSVSDGVLLVVNHASKIREHLGEDFRLGLPVGVKPPGFPQRIDPDPPQISLTLYLYDTCHLQNGALYSVDGSIRFNSLFSGDRNENDADQRLTDATFEATVTDPRDATLVPMDSTDGGAEPDLDAGPDASAAPPVARGAVTQLRPRYAHTSKVRGSFHFFFERGIPAQPFP